MGRGLERTAGYLPDFDPGQNAPSWSVQDASTFHIYHLSTRLRRVRRVMFGTPLDKSYSRSHRQALQLHYYCIMRHIALLPDDQELR